MRHVAVPWLVAALLLSPAVRGAPGDEPRVRLPLALWNRVADALALAEAPLSAEAPTCLVERRLEGEFRKGLLRATLTARFEVLDAGGFVEVPVLDARASLVTVLLDGAPASPFRADDMYVLGVERPGAHTLEVAFLLGEEKDRFARELSLRLPPSGPTHVELRLPEPDIEPHLARGALREVREERGGTFVAADLDATGELDLAWTRRLTHRGEAAVRLETRLDALLTVQESLVAGVAVFDVSVLEGETDRIDLLLPPELEVVDVEGEALLQWRTDAPTTGMEPRDARPAGASRGERSESRGEASTAPPAKGGGTPPRKALRLPPEIEVVDVEGEALLQWRTDAPTAPPPTGTPPRDAREAPGLTLLLRYLVADTTRVVVHFQYPVDIDAPVPLRLPMPLPGTLTAGTAGVQAPAGLNVRIASAEGGETLTTRDLPPELTALTSNPLLFGFRFTDAPRVTLAVSRHAPVELTGTVVDELEASTLLLEDGSEIAKVKLHVRNNTRQYLTLALPEGALLTHSLLDGVPFRPALAAADAPGRLLLPLRQSERIDGDAARTHVVRHGETLGSIALRYYSNPNRWHDILDGNRDLLATDTDLRVGQRLHIPAVEGVRLEESQFVIELAYRRQGPPFGVFGRTRVALPEVDLETLKVTWHLYVPEAVLPLDFDGNLTQYTALRYDPVRRLRDFLYEALGVGAALAGGDYKDILSQRKAIFRSEQQERASDEVVLSDFPLVGERYRFKRILAARETPTLTLTYAARSLVGGARWVGFLAALGLVTLVVARRRRLWARFVGGLGLLALLVPAYFVLGVHRRMVWGAALALLVAVLRLRGPAWWAAVRRRVGEPWRLPEALTLRNFVVLVGLLGVTKGMAHFPMLLSLLALATLAVTWVVAARAARTEDDHAK